MIVAPEVQAEKSVEAKFKSGDKISFTIDGESATAVVDYVEGDGDIYGRFDDDILEAHGHFINAGSDAPFIEIDPEWLAAQDAV